MSERPMKRKTKRRFNRSTGKFEEPGHQLDTGQWWREATGTDKPGSGALAKKRKKVIDDKVKEAE